MWKIKKSGFSCSFACFWEESVKTQFVWSILGVYGVYGPSQVVGSDMHVGRWQS
jgi:hypothetical protein